MFRNARWIRIVCEIEADAVGEGFMRVRHPCANVSPALIASLVLSCNSPTIRGQVAPPAPLFVVHGTARNCSSITQLDSALSGNYQAFFAGWSEQDYRGAIAWSQACADSGWHVPGRPRIPLLQAQRDKALVACNN